jgi:hypothetical protein
VPLRTHQVQKRHSHVCLTFVSRLSWKRSESDKPDVTDPE